MGNGDSRAGSRSRSAGRTNDSNANMSSSPSSGGGSRPSAAVSDDTDGEAGGQGRRQDAVANSSTNLVDVYAILRQVLMGDAGSGVHTPDADSDESDEEDERHAAHRVIRIDTLQSLLTDSAGRRKRRKGHSGAVFEIPAPSKAHIPCFMDEAAAGLLKVYKQRLGHLYEWTRSASGLPQCGRPQSGSLVAALRQRELGAHRWNGNGAAAAEQCRISNGLLPNVRHKVVSVNSHGHTVDTLKTKTFCCAYIDSGDTVMTASQDRTIRLYSPRGAKQQYVCRKQIAVPEVGWSILDVAVSPDGRNALYSTWSDRIYQCRLDDGHGATDASGNVQWLTFCVGEPSNRFCVFSLRYNSAGDEVLCGCADTSLLVFSRHLDRTVLTIPAHEDDVNAVCYADESGHILYSAGDDGLCKVWDRRALAEHRPEPVAVMAGHMDGITFIDARGDSRYLITNSKDQTIKLWDVRRPASGVGIQATKRAVSRQAWDYRWQMPSRNAGVLPRLDGDASVMTFVGHSVHPTLVRCYFSPAATTGQRYIYTGSGEGECVLYDIVTGRVAARLGGHASCVRDVAWHPRTNEIATASWDGVTACWRYRCLPDTFGLPTRAIPDGSERPGASRSASAANKERAGGSAACPAGRSKRPRQ